MIQHPAISKKWFISAIILQLLLLIIGFNKIIFHPQEHVFHNAYDGIKNYYTYISYVHQDPEHGLVKYEQMNYPFGDYIFYTDNTPVLAVAVKAFSENIYDIKDIAIPIFSYFFIFGILLSTIFLFLILRYFVRSPFLIFLSAIVLPWINPQIRRFDWGHYNLTAAWIFLLVILLLIIIYFSYKKNFTKYWLLHLLLFVVILFSSFMHLYYLVLTSALILPFYLSWTIAEVSRRNRKWWLPILSGVVTVGAAFISVLGIIRIIDRYNHLRSDLAGGYDWMEWKLKFQGLFTSYHFNKISFPISYVKELHYESHVFLGNFNLYALLFLLLAFLFLRKKTIIPFRSIYRGTPNYQLFALFALPAILALIMAFGEYYYILDNDYRFINYLNPFFYASYFSDKVTQFRCLGRFVWIFFWIFSIGMVIVVEQYIRLSRHILIFPIIGFLIFLHVSDLYSFVEHYNGTYKTNLLTQEENMQQAKQLLSGIDTENYQAIMMLPFFHTSTEEYEYTIDPDNRIYTFSLQLNMLSQLPLFNANISRMAMQHAYDQFSIFTEEKPSDAILNRLTDEPVLVVVSKYLQPGWYRAGLEPSGIVANTSMDIVDKYDMQFLKETEDYLVYEWDVKKLILI